MYRAATYKGQNVKLINTPAEAAFQETPLDRLGTVIYALVSCNDAGSAFILTVVHNRSTQPNFDTLGDTL